MSATCWPDSQMSALLADMALLCQHKIDPDTTFSCWGWPTFTPFIFLYQSTYTKPAKNLYIRSLVYNTIEKLTTTTHNNQHEPRRPTLHRLELSPSMVRPATPPIHGAAASYRLAQGTRRQVRQRRCWFPCLGRQREPYQKIERKAGSFP
jgi:hypothetical protein